MNGPSSKDMIIFDLDGTLALSKQPLDAETAELLKKLLAAKKVAVISGGSYGQFQKQFVSHMPADANFANLFLFPASGTSFYRFAQGAWSEVYSEKLPDADKAKIRSVILEAEARLGFAEPKTYGEKIEDRGSQMTYSALGQAAPLDVKKTWDPDREKRRRIAALITPFLSGFTIGIGGMTSIDVTRGGVDKGYGIRHIARSLNIPLEAMVFVGDALEPGGNDYPARQTGIDCVEVAGVPQTREFIESILSEGR